MSGYSLTALQGELEELRKDRHAFGTAYDVMCQRVLDSSETEQPRSPALQTWSGTRAVVGSLEMAIHSIERTIIEYDALIQRVLSGEVPNLDAPRRLSLVKEDETQ